MNNNLFYHYSAIKVDEIMTLREQIKHGINIHMTLKELEDMDRFYVETKKQLPYSQHISLHIDPLPLDLIKAKFPKESPYFRNKVLYEYTIDISVIKDNYPWSIVESAEKAFIDDYLFSGTLYHNSETYKSTYFKLLNTVSSILDLKGFGSNSLIRNTAKYKGHIKEYFDKWINSEYFEDQSKRMYAANVPHVKVYPLDGKLIPTRVTKLKII